MKNALHSPAVNEIAAASAGGDPDAAAKVGQEGGGLVKPSRPQTLMSVQYIFLEVVLRGSNVV
jgi:hypothetical protein